MAPKIGLGGLRHVCGRRSGPKILRVCPKWLLGHTGPRKKFKNSGLGEYPQRFLRGKSGAVGRAGT